VFSAAPLQHVVRSQGLGTVSVPAVSVPVCDLQALTHLISVGLAQFCWDPITCSDLWCSIIQSIPVICHPQLPVGMHSSAAIILTAPAVQYVLHAVKHALQCKPAAIVCYVPTAWVPSPVWQLLQALKQQSAQPCSEPALAGGWSSADLHCQSRQWLR